MFLPIMPTTVFLLMAAWLFSKSSPRFLIWLENNRFLGKYISNYRSGLGMEVKDKVITLIMLWLGLGLSELLIHKFWVQVLLMAIGLGVTAHILTLKTHRKASDDPIPLGSNLIEEE